MEFVLASKFGRVTALMCTTGRYSDCCDSLGGMGLAEALFFWIKLTQNLGYKPASWPDHHMVSLQPQVWCPPPAPHLDTTKCWSTEQTPEYMRSPPRLINTEQVVNPFAVLGPEHCFGFVLASYINSSIINSSIGMRCWREFETFVETNGFVQRVWWEVQVCLWQLFLTETVRNTIHNPYYSQSCRGKC